ncbi:MAG: hypothetical protein IIT45_01645, partial [Treponema sp.]|nr:hypothetical protein [Treponema sp.]
IFFSLIKTPLILCVSICKIGLYHKRFVYHLMTERRLFLLTNIDTESTFVASACECGVAVRHDGCG